MDPGIRLFVGIGVDFSVDTDSDPETGPLLMGAIRLAGESSISDAAAAQPGILLGVGIGIDTQADYDPDPEGEKYLQLSEFKRDFAPNGLDCRSVQLVRF